MQISYARKTVSNHAILIPKYKESNEIILIGLHGLF